MKHKKYIRNINEKKSLSLILAGVVLTAGVTGCGGNKASGGRMPDMGPGGEGTQEESSLVITEQTPEYGNMELTGSYVATISPNQSVNILSKTSGEVTEVSVSVGDSVEAGTVLARLDDTDAKRSLETAQVNYENAVSNYNYSYGDAAATISEIETEKSYQTATDTVQNNQEKLVELKSELSEIEDKLQEELKVLQQVYEDYDYTNIDDLEDKMNEYYEKYQKYKLSDDKEKTQEYLEKYTAYSTRYSQADKKESEAQEKIDSYEDQIEELKKQIESYSKKVEETYGDFEDEITVQNLKNGELKQEQKNISQNNIKSASINAESAKDKVNDCILTTPVSGVVDSVNVEVYDNLNNGATAFVITSVDTVKATFYVSDSVRKHIELGQEVAIKDDGNEYTGQVSMIGSSVDDSTGLFEVEATVNTTSQNLLTGTTVTLTTRTYHSDNTLVLPIDVIYYQNSQGYVYKDVDGEAVKTDVTVGLSDENFAEITSGLTKDDIVITSWSSKLRDGVKVRVAGTEDKSIEGKNEGADQAGQMPTEGFPKGEEPEGEKKSVEKPDSAENKKQ